MRVVLDTNVLIRAHGRRQTLARRLLVRLLQAPHRLVLSNEMLVEMSRVLRYPKFQRLYGLSDSELLEYCQFLQSFSEMVVLDTKYFAPVRDANDLAVLQTAERGRADVLCTSDRDFHDPPVTTFCAARGITILDEVTLLLRLMETLS